MMDEMNKILSGLQFNKGGEFTAVRKFRLSEGDGMPMTGRFRNSEGGEITPNAQGFARTSANVFHNYPSPLIANAARQSAVGGVSMVTLQLND